MELFTHHITTLKNGNVLFNEKEISFEELPRPIIVEMFNTETNGDGLTDDQKHQLSNDDHASLNAFFDYAERNGYPFPAIPPKELFLRWESEHTYYKYGERYQRVVTTKRGERPEDNYPILVFHEFVKKHNLMDEKEWARNEKEWREKVQNETETETVWDRKPLEEKGKRVIDWSQQTRQDEINKLIRKFYDWLSRYVK